MSEVVKKYELIGCSPKAQELCPPFTPHLARDADEPNSKYPFKSMLIGEAFVMPFADMDMGALSSLRSSASIYAKRLGRKFKVLLHEEYKCVEVARIG